MRDCTSYTVCVCLYASSSGILCISVYKSEQEAKYIYMLLCTSTRCVGCVCTRMSKMLDVFVSVYKCERQVGVCVWDEMSDAFIQTL